MMYTISNLQGHHIGSKHRKTTFGPEFDLVKKFLERFEEMFGEKGFNLSVFIEPFMDMGFPDLVGVLWNEDALRSWSKERLLISKKEIRILNHLNLQKAPKTYQDLQLELGFSSKQLNVSIKKLSEASLLVTNQSAYQSKPLIEIFAPKKIIAIEAKMTNWREAFEQAKMNQWFSSESYVLFPGFDVKNELKRYSNKTEVGLILQNNNKFESISDSKVFDIPTSYGSWLINEWIGRSMYCK